MPRGSADNPPIPSKAVPQANSLAKLRRLVELVAAGVTASPELQQGIALSPRHLGYYLLAAQTLDWVATGTESVRRVTDLIVTTRGRRLLATTQDSLAEAVAVANAIEDSAGIRGAVGSYLTEYGIGVDDLAGRIARRAGLSPATAHRRAGCLVAWRSQLEARGWHSDAPGAEPVADAAPESDPPAPESDPPALESDPPGPESGPPAPESGPPAPESGPRPFLSEPSGTEHSSTMKNRVHEPGQSTREKSANAPAGHAPPNDAPPADAPPADAPPSDASPSDASPANPPPNDAQPAPVILQPQPAFKYVTGDHAPIYRAIVQVFFAAKQRYVIELRPADVEREIVAGGFHAPLADTDALNYHLDKLVEWGNLSAAHDTAAVATIEDFHKKSFVYHLTAVGEAAHRAVLHVEATVGRSGSLQSNMLLEIRDSLRALAALGQQGAPDPERTLRSMHALFSAFDTLTGEAAHFIGEVSESFAADRIEEELFVLRKQALVTYISRFVDHLRKLAGEIAAGVRAVEAGGVERLLAAAATSADLPPPLGHEDPRAVWLDTQRHRWAGMKGWFCAVGGLEPTVERLAAVAVEAILGLTRALGRLNSQRTQPVDRQADYLTLARWFSACGTNREAHKLYEAAFGLYGVRHFHIAEEDPDLARPGESWWQTAPVTVPTSLRARGRLSRAGRPAAAPDHGAGRAWIAQRQRREREQLASAQRRFAGKGEMCLSDLAEISSAELDLLLALLDEALASPRRADGSRITRTADGRLTVVLRPPDDPEAWTELSTPRGRLRCRDYRIEVREGAGTRSAPKEVAS